MVNLTSSWETDADQWKAKFYDTFINRNTVTSEWTKQLKEQIAKGKFLRDSEMEFLAHFTRGKDVSQPG